jgi:hypothetical protein
MNKKPLRYSLVAATAFFSLCLAGRSGAETQTRNVGKFDAVAMTGAGTLDVTVGQEGSVAIEGDSDVLRHYETEIRDGTLYIGPPRDRLWFGFHGDLGKVAVRITLPRLTALSFSGSGDTNVAGLAGGMTSLTVNGSGSMKAQGQLDRLILTINGSGHADLPNLAIDDALVIVNGSADVVLQPRQSLAATINGSGKVQYVSVPAKITSVIRGIGTVQQE